MASPFFVVCLVSFFPLCVFAEAHRPTVFMPVTIYACDGTCRWPLASPSETVGCVWATTCFVKSTFVALPCAQCVPRLQWCGGGVQAVKGTAWGQVFEIVKNAACNALHGLGNPLPSTHPGYTFVTMQTSTITGLIPHHGHCR